MNHTRQTDKTIDQLREEADRLRKKLALLKEQQATELKYREFFEQSSDGITIIDQKTADIVEFNESAFKCLGYTRKEFKKLRLGDLGLLESPAEKKDHLARVFVDGDAVFETRHKRKDGQIRDILTRSKRIKISGRPFFVSVWTDITEQKRAEALLRKRQAELENTVTTLNVLLKQIEIDRNVIERNILSNLEELVGPYIRKLDNACKKPDQKKYLEIIKLNMNNLNDKLSNITCFKDLKLTPTERQVANFIKHHRTSKEISEIMKIAVSTVDFHRKNIRKKLNLKNSKKNLKNYLSDLN